ncbi:MAG TPA: hypothetical protein VHA33_15490 [Candidatus Angelobacter sp.]|nr:hypothetical protein [Candidatus Angelobacter sp.]
MNTVAKRIEIVANIAITLATLILIGVTINHYLATRFPPQHIPVGAKITLHGIQWHNKQTSVVFALSTDCHFCAESAEFYRKLVQQCKHEHVRTIAVLPQAITIAEAYLKSADIQFDEVRHITLSDIGVSGTPTLLLVSDSGLVRNIWVGKLPGDVEMEVLAKARS